MKMQLFATLDKAKPDTENNKIFKKSFIFWDITPCSPLKAIGLLEETCRRHLKVGGIIQGRDQHETSNK
jgi:hypothetical protein